MRDIFSEYYQNNFWHDDESRSGQGSSVGVTHDIREALPKLFAELGIKSVLDIPCGDYNWWQHIKGIENVRYVGGDIVSELILENTAKYPGVDFRMLDITRDRLPRTELVFVRDLLGHFSNYDVQQALKKIYSTGAKWLVATTFPEHFNDGDIKTGEWRPINLASLFGLPDPDILINEGIKIPGFDDKSLGVWDIEEQF